MEGIFEIGDLVRLRSGGPQMAVIFIGDTTVDAQWPDGNETKTDSFEKGSLFNETKGW